MHVFPAQVPPPEAPRSDIVEVRLARKVAPLFGVGRDIPPFRRTWVCDYTSLSLAEIGRGAPLPSREERARLESEWCDPPSDQDLQWRWSGRAVWSSKQHALPGALSNATLNRYGPDTKAAAVLSAANRLLREATTAIAAAARHLADTGCDPEVRLATWAGLVLEVYRSQPALVVAAVQARQVQRSLSTQWGEQVDGTGLSGAGAPAEVQPWPPDHHPDDADSRLAQWRPTTFDLVDATLPLLGLAEDTPAGPALVTADALDDIASAWCQRLLAIGRPGRGVVWLVEDDTGSRWVHAMVRVGAVVAPFVAATLSGTSAGRRSAPPVLPSLPTKAGLAAGSRWERRAHLLSVHIAVNYVRYRDELLKTWPRLRPQTRDLVDEAVRRCGDVLEQDDPVQLLLQAYVAYLNVVDASEKTRSEAVEQLIASQWRVMAAWQDGHLDPGAVAYLLEIGIVALTDPTSQQSLGQGTVPCPDPSALRTWWRAVLTARGLDPEADLAATITSLPDAQVFHLHRYAAWLAASGRRADLRRALTVQERVAAVRAEVVRREPANYAVKSWAARSAHELATEIAVNLALATPDREHRARAAVLETALRHAHAVLVDPSTDTLLRPAGSDPPTVRAAEVVARALCVAAAHGLPVPQEDIVAALRLLDAATATDGTREWRLDDSRRATLLGWRAELTALAGAEHGPST